MNYADQRSIPFVIMIGPEEIKNDIFVVKDMRTGDQSKHSISSIVSIIRKIFSVCLTFSWSLIFFKGLFQ